MSNSFAAPSKSPLFNFFNKSEPLSIFGPRLNKKLANARQIAIYLAKEMTGESYPYIGECFNRKHTTIMYSHEKVKSDMVHDRNLSLDIKELTDKINM